MTIFDVYDYLKPPLELIEHLERYEAKQQLPASIMDFLRKWRVIRSDQPFELDNIEVESEAVTV